MNRVLLVGLLGLGALLIAAAIARLRPAATAVRTGAVPDHVDRSLFVGPDQQWLIAMFTAESCMSCARVVDQIRGLESSVAAVQELEVRRDPALHKRYDIESVPTTLVADQDGVVRLAFVGPLSPADRSTIATLIA